MDIKLAKTNIRKQVGGSLLTSILSLGRVFGPTIAKTMGLAALAGASIYRGKPNCQKDNR